MNSTHSEEVLLAILADLQGEPAELIAERIITRLGQLSKGKLELAQRTLQLVRLAVLRNLGPTVFNTAKKMAITIDIKEDALYQEGLQEGKAAGKEEGELEGKEKAALNMLKKGMGVALISEITELPQARIAQLKQQLEAGQ